MRLVVQRVKSSSVLDKENQKVTGKIEKGYLVLVGIGKNDKFSEVKPLAQKLAKLRIMSDKDGKIGQSLEDTNADILVVSQFTLYADTTGGNRPSFMKAAGEAKAKKFYEEFIFELRKTGLTVKEGSFGKYMEIKAILDGPVTILY